MRTAGVGIVPALQPLEPFALEPKSERVDVFTGGASAFRVARWREALRYLEHEARAGRLSAVILDLDNVLMRPKGFLASEAQEQASVLRVPRDDVLARRDRDERRMVAHGFFEPAAGLREEDLAALERLRSEYGVKLIGATARPKKIAGRTERILDLVGVKLDRLLFTGGSGAKKAEQLAALDLELEKTVAIDDRSDNVGALAKAGVRTILYDPPDPNYASLTSQHYRERAERSSASGDRFEYLVNAYALGSRAEKDSTQALAERLLSRRQLLRFGDAIRGIEAIVDRDTTAPRPLTDAEAKWSEQALAALLGTQEPPAGFDARAFLFDESSKTEQSKKSGATALGKLFGADAVDRVARAIVDCDGRDPSELRDRVAGALHLAAVQKTKISARALESFLTGFGDAIRARAEAIFEQRDREDRHRFEDAMREHPDLSIEEIRRQLVASSPHLTAAHVEKLDLTRTRAIDRMGREPNLLRAAHHALAVMRGEAPPDDRLRAIYPFIPAQPIPLGSLPEALRTRLLQLETIPHGSEMFREWSALSRLPPVLEGASMVTVDHALADKFSFYQHLILEEGARGSDIHAIWKPHSADPIMVDLAERSLGLRSEVAKDDADLERLAKQRATEVAEDPSTRRMFVHLTGVKAWSWLDRLAAANPHVAIDGVSHTTSDADELRRPDVHLEHTSVSVMADADAKIRYERFMFARSFERMLEELPDRFRTDVPDLEDRHLVVHGAAGKIIGSGVVDALLAMARSSVDGRAPFPKITLVDPMFADPELSARRSELEAAGFRVVAGTEIPKDVKGDALLAINCTAEDVWSKDAYRSLGHRDLVFMNLGTGQKGCALSDVELHATARERFGPAGHQGSFRYDLAFEGGKELRLYNLADGYPYNLTTRTPNPPFYSDFNNLLITMSLHHASKNRAKGELGARVLDMANVSFTWHEEEGRPIICLLPDDLPPDFRWPTEYDGAWFRDNADVDPRRPVLFEDLGKSGDVARFLSLLAKKERSYPGTVEKFFAAKRAVGSAAEPMIEHIGAPGPSKTVQVVDVPSRLLGPNCVLTSAPKSDLAGDIIGLRFTGDVPEFRAEASFGLMVETRKDAVTVAVKPSLEHPGEPRRLRLFDREDRLLLDLTIPIQERTEPAELTAAERTALMRTPPVASFTIADNMAGRNRHLRPGSVFKVTLPENGETWVPACVAHASAWFEDARYQLLGSRRIDSRLGVAMREMIFRVRPDALRWDRGDAPAALSIFSYRPGETYEDWSNRRGGSGADYTLSLVITSA